ncbi:MAG TPA: CRTAC1 family protein [Candidatus Polarisedimenticolaceae bacterium]|nr:CRTAC1 family protein [Candidatus Polarisedimenticolaceae bacterium]
MDFTQYAGAGGSLYMPEITGSGVALFDFDEDGDLDLYFVNANSDLYPAAPRVAPGNRMYRQDPGGKLVDVTARAGLSGGGFGQGAYALDFDNDGHLDLYLTNFGPDQLYRNRGDGTFEDVTARAGVAVDGWSTSAAVCDYDGDGFLDVFVARYVRWDRSASCPDPTGRIDYCTPRAFTPASDVLLHNQGDGTFRDVSVRAGLRAADGPGLGVVCEDLNADGRLDFYVADDQDPNQLWINRGDGTFRDEAMMRGAAVNLEGRPEAGMGVVAADMDGDLDLDLFVTHLVQQHNTFYRNLGEARGFIDATGPAGLGVNGFPFTGFGVAAFDIELDGDLDVVVANGRVMRGDLKSTTERRAPWNRYAEEGLIHANRGDGVYELAQDRAPDYTRRMEVSRALAVGDLDNDGDLDFVVTNVDARARLYRNVAARRGRWLEVRAIDPRRKRDAIGARLTLRAGGRTLLRTITTCYSYLCSNDPRAHFGLGSSTRVDELEVRWPDGRVERFAVPDVDREIRVVRGEGKAVS